METHATRDALLDAAEELIAEHGVDGTSLRAVTGSAGANLAAVHYYFGSKEGLVQEVFARRMAPLARERLSRLDACGTPSDATLECIVRAFVEPFVELGWRMDRGRSLMHLAGRLVARVITEPGDQLRETLAGELRETFERFTDSLERALPHLDRDEVIARLNFVIGTLVHSVAGIRLYAEEDRALERSEALVERLVGFVAAGLRAPATRTEAAVGAAPTREEDAR